MASIHISRILHAVAFGTTLLICTCSSATVAHTQMFAIIFIHFHSYIDIFVSKLYFFFVAYKEPWFPEAFSKRFHLLSTMCSNANFWISKIINTREIITWNAKYSNELSWNKSGNMASMWYMNELRSFTRFGFLSIYLFVCLSETERERDVFIFFVYN